MLVPSLTCISRDMLVDDLSFEGRAKTRGLQVLRLVSWRIVYPACWLLNLHLAPLCEHINLLSSLWSLSYAGVLSRLYDSRMCDEPTSSFHIETEIILHVLGKHLWVVSGR